MHISKKSAFYISMTVHSSVYNCTTVYTRRVMPLVRAMCCLLWMVVTLNGQLFSQSSVHGSHMCALILV